MFFLFFFRLQNLVLLAGTEKTGRSTKENLHSAAFSCFLFISKFAPNGTGRIHGGKKREPPKPFRT